MVFHLSALPVDSERGHPIGTLESRQLRRFGQQKSEDRGRPALEQLLVAIPQSSGAHSRPSTRCRRRGHFPNPFIASPAAACRKLAVRRRLRLLHQGHSPVSRHGFLPAEFSASPRFDSLVPACHELGKRFLARARSERRVHTQRRYSRPSRHRLPANPAEARTPRLHGNENEFPGDPPFRCDREVSPGGSRFSCCQDGVRR